MSNHECPTTKVCKECGEDKSIDCFGSYYDKCKEKRYHRAKCKDCINAISKKVYDTDATKKAIKLARQKVQRAEPETKQRIAIWHKKFNQENAESISVQKAEYRARPEVKAAEKVRSDAYYAERKSDIQAKRKARLDDDLELKEAEQQRLREHYQNNVSYYTEKTERRRARTRKATPAWYDCSKAVAIREEARILTLETGTPHEVDHIIPLQGKLVSGLHWHGNMQILTRAENRTKSNKFS